MPIGLTIRMAGENPVANEAQGINVLLIRTGAVMAGSALMAIGGAFLTMSAFDAFYFGMINGRGWICVALVIFASWKPGKAFLGAILFALFFSASAKDIVIKDTTINKVVSGIADF